MWHLYVVLLDMRDSPLHGGVHISTTCLIILSIVDTPFSMPLLCDWPASPEFILSFLYKWFRSDNIILGCCGFHGDVLAVTKTVKAQMKVSH